MSTAVATSTTTTSITKSSTAQNVAISSTVMATRCTISSLIFLKFMILIANLVFHYTLYILAFIYQEKLVELIEKLTHSAGFTRIFKKSKTLFKRVPRPENGSSKD